MTDTGIFRITTYVTFRWLAASALSARFILSGNEGTAKEIDVSPFILHRDEAASKGYRFYWKPVQKGLIIISPVRKLDEDWACNHVELFDRLIDTEFGK